MPLLLSTIRASIASLTGLAVPIAVLAQAPPDASVLRQQVEPILKSPLPGVFSLPAPAERERSPGGGPQVMVKRFEVIGATLLPADEIQSVLATFEGRKLTFAELENATTRLGQAFRDRGWVVRVTLPPQEVAGGVIKIEVVEAKLGAFELGGEASPRVSGQRIKQQLQHSLDEGQALNSKALDSAMLLVDDLPGINARSLLRAGKEEGLTDVFVDLKNQPAVVGSVIADNHGSRSTGRSRVLATMTWNSPMARGDALDLTAVKTSHSLFVRAGGSLPVAKPGTRLGLYASQQDYSIGIASARFTGSSKKLELQATGVFTRSLTRNVYWELTGAREQLINSVDAGGLLLSDYGISTVGGELRFNRFDKYLAGGVTAGSLNMTAGRPDLSGSPQTHLDSVAASRSGDSFVKATLNLSRSQQLDKHWSFALSAQGQWANRNMVSGQWMYLGGAQGVRAYPSSEAGGAQGLIGNLTVRYQWRPQWRFTAFVDAGRVRQNVDNNLGSASASHNLMTLKGAGAGVTWITPVGASLNLMWAHRIGDNPNPTPDGKDQDGSLINNRIWVQASYPF